MAKTGEYHTSEPETPEVYHNDAACPNGQRIKKEHLVSGRGYGRKLCDWCASN
ncbi:MAG: hypothetical protein QOF68_1598 [Gaiellales bacterium]|jgi:hypothetical protein|nr:hypothetical protein [Gaiellales bacterium]